MSEQVLHALLRKRADMMGEVEALRAKLTDTLANLDHIEATIRIYNPNIATEDMPERAPPPPSAAFRGEVQRFLLQTLRMADGPMTTQELAHAVMANRRLSTADRVLTKLIEHRTGHSLSRLRRQGHVVSERFSRSALLRWRVGTMDTPACPA